MPVHFIVGVMPVTREGSVLSTYHCGCHARNFIVGVMPVTREGSVLSTLHCGCYAIDKRAVYLVCFIVDVIPVNRDSKVVY